MVKKIFIINRLWLFINSQIKLKDEKKVKISEEKQNRTNISGIPEILFKIDLSFTFHKYISFRKIIKVWKPLLINPFWFPIHLCFFFENLKLNRGESIRSSGIYGSWGNPGKIYYINLYIYIQMKTIKIIFFFCFLIFFIQISFW